MRRLGLVLSVDLHLNIYLQIVCISSIAQLEELSGVKGITDLHRDKIDHITIPSKKGKGVLKRIDEIFDCWFESGRFVVFLAPQLIC